MLLPKKSMLWIRCWLKQMLIAKASVIQSIKHLNPTYGPVLKQMLDMWWNQ